MLLTLVANLPPVSLIPVAICRRSLTPVANLPPVSMTPVVPVARFSAGVVDTGGKFAAGFVDNGGAALTCNKSHDTVPLKMGENLQEKTSIRKVLIILFGYLWVEELTCRKKKLFLQVHFKV